MAYSKVERHMWNDDRFRRFTRDVREMWFYLLTCEHSNRVGMFVLDPLYAVADLSAPDDRWTEARVLSSLASLNDAGMISFDPDARLVLIRKHLKHNAPENPNVAKSALLELAELPFSETLSKGFLKACRKYCRMQTKTGQPFCDVWVEFVEGRMSVEARKSLQDISRETLCEGFAEPFRKGMPNPEPEPEPLTTTAGALSSADDPEGGKPNRKRSVQLPIGWTPTDQHYELADKLGVGLEGELEQFKDFHTAKGTAFRDWDAAFRTWLRNAKKFGSRYAKASGDDVALDSGVWG